MLELGGRVGAADIVLAVTHGGVIRTIEDHLGILPRGTRNLGGRWFAYEAGTLVAGETVALGS